MKKEYSYPKINLAKAYPEMIPLLEKTLNHLASSQKEEHENRQYKEVYACLAANIAYFGSREGLIKAEQMPEILYDIHDLFGESLGSNNTACFDVWWSREYDMPTFESEYIQKHRRIWLTKIIQQLKDHFQSDQSK